MELFPFTQTFTGLDYQYNGCRIRNRKCLPFSRECGFTSVFWLSRIFYHFNFMCGVFCFVSLRSVSCDQSCLCLQIVDCRLALQFTIAFISIGKLLCPSNLYVNCYESELWLNLKKITLSSNICVNLNTQTIFQP